MERKKASDYPRDFLNLSETYVHAGMAVRSCVALAILLSWGVLSAQTVEDPQAQYNRGVEYWYGNGVPQDYVEAK